jgi:uncharacterized membrane protein
MTYLTLKYIHIMSMLLLFGVGLGSAFYKWMADRSGDLPHIAVTNRHVVLADWMFTTPTVIIQPLTGLYLAHLIGLPLTTPWIAISLGLYLLAGLCWLPVVWLQLQMRTLAQTSLEHNSSLPTQYWRYADIWFWLGVPAFTAMLLIVFLMVFKGSLGG